MEKQKFAKKDRFESKGLLIAICLSILFHLSIVLYLRSLPPKTPQIALDQFKVVYKKSAKTHSIPKKIGAKIKKAPKKVHKRSTVEAAKPLPVKKAIKKQVEKIPEEKQPTKEPSETKETKESKESKETPPAESNGAKTDESSASEPTPSEPAETPTKGEEVGGVVKNGDEKNEITTDDGNRLLILPLNREKLTSEELISSCEELTLAEKRRTRALIFKFSVDPNSGEPQNIEEIEKSGNDEFDKTLTQLISMMKFELKTDVEECYLPILVVTKSNTIKIPHIEEVQKREKILIK